MLCRLIFQTIRTGFPTARKRLGRFNLEVKYPLMNGLFFGNCKGPALPSAGTDITLTCLFSALKTNRITYVLFNFFHVIIFGAPTKSLFQGLRRVFPPFTNPKLLPFWKSKKKPLDRKPFGLAPRATPFTRSVPEHGRQTAMHFWHGTGKRQCSPRIPADRSHPRKRPGNNYYQTIIMLYWF